MVCFSRINYYDNDDNKEVIKKVLINVVKGCMEILSSCLEHYFIIIEGAEMAELGA